MINYLKYASYIVVAVTIAYVCATLKDCGPADHIADRIVIPQDSAFLPTVERNYRPNPLSVKRASKPVSKLPKGTRESDVTRTIEVANHTKASTALIIETKSGEIFVPKTNDSISVVVINYLPAVVSIDLNAGLGLSLDLSPRVSPSLSLGLLKWYGCVDAPIIVADLHGIGIGIEYKFYYEIYISPAVRWNYESLEKTIILNVSYEL